MNATRPMMRLHLNTMSGRLMAGTLTLALTAAACAGNEPAATGVTPDGTTTRVVATTTVLADLVAQVGGDLVTVTPLVPLGGEVHTFDPSPSDAVTISEAELVVMNGLGLDEWLRDLAQNAGAADVTVVELAEDLDGVDYLEPAAPGGDDDHAGESANPHLWLKIGRAHV